jgi:DNA-nicking Smr family endonuclease
MASEATCDLHGLTRDEAHFKLGDFIDECVRKRLKKVLIVHGKGIHSDTLAANGESILAAEVRSFIEADPRLGAFGRAPGKDGGAGATWVIIK